MQVAVRYVLGSGSSTAAVAHAIILLSAGRCVGERAARKVLAAFAAVEGKPAAAAARESPAGGLLSVSVSSKAHIPQLASASLRDSNAHFPLLLFHTRTACCTIRARQAALVLLLCCFLQAYQASLAGGLHVTQKVLREASFSGNPVQSCSKSDTMSGETGSNCSEGAAAGGLSFTDGAALLQKIDAREEAVQQVRCNGPGLTVCYCWRILKAA
jgi:hypothetical protein